MSLNPFGGTRDRLNQAVSARVTAQLDGRDAALTERIDELEETVVALQQTLTTRQRLITEASSTLSDRVRTVEVAQERFAPVAPSAASSAAPSTAPSSQPEHS